MEQPHHHPIEDITKPLILTMLLHNYKKHTKIAERYEKMHTTVAEFAAHLETLSTNARF